MANPVPPASPFMKDILKGKVALVTGGGSGIGYEVARQLGLHGARLVLMGRREGPLSAAVTALAAEGIDAAAATGDVRNFEDAERVVRAAVQKYAAAAAARARPRGRTRRRGADT